MGVKLKVVPQLFHNVALVTCFGLVGEEYGRKPKEMTGLTQYFLEIFNFWLEECAVNIVILCGGITRPLDFSYISESKSTLEYFEQRFNTDADIFLEELSCNTYENIVFGISQMLYLLKQNEINFNFNKSTVYIFTDKPRAIKVKIIAFLLLKQSSIKYKVISIERVDIHPNSNWKFQTLSTLTLLTNKEFWQHRKHLRNSIRNAAN